MEQSDTFDTFEKFKKSTLVISYSLDETGEDDHCVCFEADLETDMGKFKMDLPWLYECADPKEGAKLIDEIDNDPVKFIIKYIEESYEESDKTYWRLGQLEEVVEKPKPTVQNNVQNKKPTNKSANKSDCWYGELCTNDRCRFEHPENRVQTYKGSSKKSTKPCRWGDQCRNKDCQFVH